MNTPHFLSLYDLPGAQLNAIIESAIALKAEQRQGRGRQALAGRSLAMLFQKSSTRTRVSFEVGMIQLGGHALFLSPRDTQLGRGEPIADTARVISRMADLVMIRNDSQSEQEAFAAASRVPVINGLSDVCHPCQLLADVMTFVEHRGDIRGAQVAWVGDGNNVCNSFIAAAAQFGFELRIASPVGYAPDPAQLARAGQAARQVETPQDAVAQADLVVTDVWASMGQENQSAERAQSFAAFQVDAALLKLAKPDALFMHCLPAHRGEEVSADVIDGPQSVVWDEAENRLHAQKALMLELIGAS